MRSKSESQPPHAWSSHQSQSGVPCNCEDEVISNIMRGHPLSEAESHRVALNRIRPRMHVDPRDNHHRPVYVPLFQQLAPVPPSAFPEVKKRILMTGGGGQPRHSAERARQKASQPWDVEVKLNMSQRQTRKPAQNHCTMAHKDSRAKSMLSACDWNSVPHRPHMRQARPPPCAGSSLSVGALFAHEQSLANISSPKYRVDRSVSHGGSEAGSKHSARSCRSEYSQDSSAISMASAPTNTANWAVLVSEAQELGLRGRGRARSVNDRVQDTSCAAIGEGRRRVGSFSPYRQQHQAISPFQSSACRVTTPRMPDSMR